MPATRFQTADLPPGERFEAWCAFVAHASWRSRVHTERREDFTASALTISFQDIHISALSYPSLQSVRTESQIRDSDPDCYLLSHIVDGVGHFESTAGTAKVRPNEFLLASSGTPYRASHQGPAFVLKVQFPRDCMPLGPATVDPLCGIPFPATSGTAGILSRFLADVVRQAGDHSELSEAALRRVSVDLLAAVCAERLDKPSPSDEESLVLRIYDFIERKLANPALSPDLIATAHQISRRQLHRLFASQEMGVAAWIRRRRLERCREDLRDPCLRHRPLHALAARWGFVDGAHFSRLFSATYGLPPSEYRRGTLASASQVVKT